MLKSHGILWTVSNYKRPREATRCTVSVKNVWSHVSNSPTTAALPESMALETSVMFICTCFPCWLGFPMSDPRQSETPPQGLCHFHVGYIAVVGHCLYDWISCLELESLIPNLLGLEITPYPLFFSLSFFKLLAHSGHVCQGYILPLLILLRFEPWRACSESWTLCPYDSWSVFLCKVPERTATLTKWALVRLGISRLPQWQHEDGIRCADLHMVRLIRILVQAWLRKHELCMCSFGVRKGVRGKVDCRWYLSKYLEDMDVLLYESPHYFQNCFYYISLI